jgi:hypothetical protein
MEKVSHYICLSLDPAEIVTGCFHNLKSKNIFSCVSKILFSTENYKIVKKTGTLDGLELDIILTYYRPNETPSKLMRGYLYINKKEYEIKSACMYRSLQIGEWCYDNIQVIQPTHDIFE